MYEAKLLFIVCLTLGIQCANGIGDAEFYRISHLRDLVEHSGGETKYKRLNGLKKFALHSRSGSVYVSVNNSVLRLSLDTLKKLSEVTWASPEEHSAECNGFSVKSPSCEPYTVTLLVPVDDVPHPDGSNVIRTGLYTCLSNNIFSECSLRRAADLRVPPELHWRGNDRCPADVNKPTVATVAANGHIYMGTEVITRDSGKAISILRVAADTNRARSPDAVHISRTEFKDDWIIQNERTTFVHSFEYNNAVYFIFKELAQEIRETCGKEVMVARVGRICLADDGGKDGLLRSFTKATLVCPSQESDESGAMTFIHSELQSVHVDQSTKMLYAVFTTPSFAPPSSAICAYRLTDIERVFEGPLFSTLEKPIKVKNEGNCDLPPSSEPLRLRTMYDIIRPRADLPLVTKDVRWLHLAVSWAPFTLKRDNNLILFTVDEVGILQKWHHFKSMTCLVEEIHLQSSYLGEETVNEEVLRVELLDSYELDKAALFVATGTHLYRLPLARCGRLGHSQETCELLHDPYCGWNEESSMCELLGKGHKDVLKFEACPVKNAKPQSVSIDGGWGTWSPWSACVPTKNSSLNSRWKKSADSSAGPSWHNFEPFGCRCRYRYCTFPYPFGPVGKHCDEASAIQLSNCSVNGGWTEWTPWSGCEPTCLLRSSTRLLPAQRMRQRWCTNPAPMGSDGRDCVGERKEFDQCPSPDVTCPAELQVLPSWSDWSAWSRCSSACNGGKQLRWRLCGRHASSVDPPPLDIRAKYDQNPISKTTDCLGEAYEERPCNSHPCPLTKMITAWSDWYLTDEDPQFGTTERRFRAECLATVPEVDKLQASIDLQQGHCKQRWNGTLDCSAEDFTKAQLTKLDTEQSWSAWSDCSLSCGGGKRYRWQRNTPWEKTDRLMLEYERPPPESDIEVEACNNHPCPGYWGCWSSWSSCTEPRCSPTRGQQRRYRECMLPANFSGTTDERTEVDQCDGGVEYSAQSSPCEITAENVLCFNHNATRSSVRHLREAETTDNKAKNPQIQRPTQWAGWSECFRVEQMKYDVQLRARERSCANCEWMQARRCDTRKYVEIDEVMDKLIMDKMSNEAHFTAAAVIATAVVAALLGIAMVLIPYIVCTSIRKKRKKQILLEQSSVWRRLLNKERPLRDEWPTDAHSTRTNDQKLSADKSHWNTERVDALTPMQLGQINWDEFITANDPLLTHSRDATRPGLVRYPNTDLASIQTLQDDFAISAGKAPGPRPPSHQGGTQSRWDDRHSPPELPFAARHTNPPKPIWSAREVQQRQRSSLGARGRDQGWQDSPAQLSSELSLGQVRTGPPKTMWSRMVVQIGVPPESDGDDVYASTSYAQTEVHGS